MRSLLIILIFFITITMNAQWTKTNLPSYAWSFTTNGESIYAGTLSSGIYRSDDNGSTWTQINNGLTRLQVWSIKAIDNLLLAGTTNGGIFISTDKGVSWSLSNNGIASTTIIKDFAFFDSKIFATSSNAGVYVSNNSGKDWSQLNNGITGLVASTFLTTDMDLFVGVMQKVYKYDAVNFKWVASSSGIPNNTVSSLSYMKTNKYLFASISNSGSAVTKSIDNGTTWNVVDNGLPKVPVATLTTIGNTLFAGNDYGVYMSTDFGANWQDANQGFSGASYATFLSSDKFFLYVIYKGDVYKRLISDFGITSVENSTETPVSFELSQNYPNPFNPTTAIKFSLAKTGHVSLKVYDALGNEITTIVNEELTAGIHQVSFNASKFSSGIYFYTLNSNNNLSTKKMILIK